jgi:prephenate dehydrogenase
MHKCLKECRVAVVGLGLMGASLCIDLIQNHVCREVRGVARRTDTVLEAFFSGAVDLATNDLHTGILGADIVILATPVRTIVSMLEELGPHLWPGTVIIDMGSTKSEICAAMDRMPDSLQPIGGHPMTGKEVAGFQAAEAGLYRDATWVLTPLARTSQDAFTLAQELVLAVGARPVTLDANRHDQLVASVSHLPYLVASALVTTVAERGDLDPLVWELAAGGFRDTSRVAASDTDMFMDILMTNRNAILDQLDVFSDRVKEIRSALEDNDEEELSRILLASQQRRSTWNAQRSV